MVQLAESRKIPGVNVLEKTFSFIVSFFAMLSIFGVWFGYSALIYPQTALIAMLVSAVFSFFICRNFFCKKRERKIEKKHFLLLVGILLAFSMVFIFLLWPNGVYPSTCNDFMNHANAVKLTALRHGPFPDSSESIPLIHSYPLIYRLVSSFFYSVFPNSYVVNSLLSVFFLVITILGVFLLAKNFLNEKFALVSTFIFAFSISTFLAIDAGYLPQIMGQLFFLAAFYFHIKKNKPMLFFSLIGLWAYAHFFILFILFLVIEFLIERNFSLKGLIDKFAIPLASSIIILPETLGLILFRLIPETNKTLIKGGITVPNLIALIAFYPALLGLYLAFKKEKMKEVQAIVLAGFIFIAFLSANVVLNFFMRWSPIVSIHQFYMPAKLSFLMFIPASIFSAYGIKTMLETKSKKAKKIAKIVITLVLFFHFLYFTGFALIVLQARSFPVGFYEIGEKINQLPGPFTLGIDQCFLDIPTGIKKYSFPYNSLYDNPDPVQEKNYCRYMEAGRIFHFPWAVHKRADKIPGADIFDKEGHRIVFIGDKNVDYFLSNCSELNKPILFESGKIKVYIMRE